MDSVIEHRHRQNRNLPRPEEAEKCPPWRIVAPVEVEAGALEEAEPGVPLRGKKTSLSRDKSSARSLSTPAICIKESANAHSASMTSKEVHQLGFLLDLL